MCLLGFIFNGNLLVSFDLYYPKYLVTKFSWPPTRDTRNYQLLVICHARSNVMSLNLSLKKRSKHNNKNHKAVLKLWILVLRKKILIINISRPFWLFRWRPFLFSLPTSLKSFGFLSTSSWAYLRKIITETRNVG